MTTNPEDSPTPRTDAEVATDETICERNYLPSGWVPSDFARQLERELIEAQRKLAIVAKAVDAAEALDNASTEKEVEARCTFNESMAQVCLDQEEVAHATTKTQLAESCAREAVLREALAIYKPLPVADILERLTEATDHLFDAHDCDQHGWEAWRNASIQAPIHAGRIRAALAQPAPHMVPKSIADGLAEALDDMVNKASPLASHPHLASYVHHDSEHWQKARAALAAYRKEVTP